MPTIGKICRLQKCGTQHGNFVMFALDHRGNLRRALSPAAPDQVSYEQMVTFKLHLTSVISPTASGLLLDAEYGVAPAIANGALAPSCGLLVAVEQSGYTGEPSVRRSQLLPGWSVEKISRMGADGVKLLVYYHPDAANVADQEALIDEVAESCQKHDMPFFLEPLSCSLDPAVKRLPSAEKRELVIETARRLTPMGVDVLKAEFPLNIADESDEAVWAEACAELSQASCVPWVLLSAGVGFEEFARQTMIACQAGASGVLAGRAVWKEAAQMNEAERDIFLRISATERMGRLAAIVRAYGRPWMEFHPSLPGSVTEGWYESY
jgi:tagatose 1,6-diphosphate aldolase